MMKDELSEQGFFKTDGEVTPPGYSFLSLIVGCDCCSTVTLLPNVCSGDRITIGSNLLLLLLEFEARGLGWAVAVYKRHTLDTKEHNKICRRTT